MSPLDARTLKLAAPQVAAALVPNPGKVQQVRSFPKTILNNCSKPVAMVHHRSFPVSISQRVTSVQSVQSSFPSIISVRSNTKLLHVGRFSSVSPAFVDRHITSIVTGWEGWISSVMVRCFCGPSARRRTHKVPPYPCEYTPSTTGRQRPQGEEAGNLVVSRATRASKPQLSQVGSHESTHRGQPEPPMRVAGRPRRPDAAVKRRADCVVRVVVSVVMS
jgi:hypothetical protein